MLLFLLALLFGGIVYFPQHDFQLFLAQGDHGRDLYCFKATLDGQMPYRDYWWVYGPLMPYYYSFFLKILGTSVQSVLWGQIFLNLVSGGLFFLILSLFVSPLLSFTGALWYWVFAPNFFYTYNHAGAVTCMMTMVYFLFVYLKNPRNRYLYFALLSIFTLAFIKINFGITSLFVFICSFFLINKLKHRTPFPEKPRIYLLSFLILPLVIFLVHYLLLRGLPVYEIRQCFPYLSSDHPHNTSIFMALGILFSSIWGTFFSSLSDFIFGILVMLCLTQTLLILKQKKLDQDSHRNTTAALLILGFLALINLHEFFASGIVFYRTFWAKPFSMLLTFLLIGTALNRYSKFIQNLLSITLISIVLITYYNHCNFLNSVKIPSQYLALKNGKVFTGNGPGWTDTVTQTTQYLLSKLGKDEKFFALPYDPLYYYLTDRKSPTRQLIFFDHINIAPEQENEVIQTLEKNSIQYILISNRAQASEPGLGLLGVTYCKLLGQYILKNYRLDASFGEINSDAGWVTKHGVKILKRIAR